MYKMGNQKLYIEEQTIQWPSQNKNKQKPKRQKDKQKKTNY